MGATEGAPGHLSPQVYGGGGCRVRKPVMTGIRPCCPERRAVGSRFSFAILVEGAWCWSRWCICCFGVRSRWRRCGCVRVSSRSLRSSYSARAGRFAPAGRTAAAGAVGSGVPGRG